MEMAEVRRLLSICYKLGVTCVLDKMTESLNAIAAESAESSAEGFVHPNRVEVHVAKIIPVLNNFIFHDVWPTQLLTVEPLRFYGRNIYEAFSK